MTGCVGGAGVDPILTVLGRSNNAAHTSFQINTVFMVNGSFASTNVVRRGSVVLCDTDDINVGQRVRLFGSLSGIMLDVSTAADVARLQPTKILGYADVSRTPLPSGSGDPEVNEDLGIKRKPVVGTTRGVDLARVGLRQRGAFLWSEGGVTPADPDAVTVAIGNLANGLGIITGTAVEVFGFFTPVDGTEGDFEATALVNRDLAPSLLLIHDRFGGMTVTTTSPTSIQFAISSKPGLAELALVARGFVGATPLPTTPSPTSAPAGPFGIYLITDRVTGEVSVNLDFAGFNLALEGLLSQGAVVRRFTSGSRPGSGPLPRG